MGQIDRLVYIVDCLMENGSVNKLKIAAEMGVTERQIRRDFLYLETNGIFDLGAISLKWDPQRKMHVASPETVDRIQKWRIRKAGAEAEHRSEKESGGLSNTVRLDSRYIVHKSYAKEEFRPDVYIALMQAIRERRLVSFKYLGGRALSEDKTVTTENVVEPVRLVKYGELWYCYAVYKGSRSRGIYTFNLSRITSIRLLDEKAAWDSELNHKIDNVVKSYGIFYGKGEARIYKIRFTGWAADNVEAQIWQENQKIEWNDDRTALVLSMPVSVDTELMGRILFYGDCAEPLEPQDFVERYREKCLKMADRYR